MLKMAWQPVCVGSSPGGLTTREWPARPEMGSSRDAPGNSREKTRADQAPAAMTRRVQGTSVSVDEVVSPMRTVESSPRRSVLTERTVAGWWSRTPSDLQVWRRKSQRRRGSLGLGQVSRVTDSVGEHGYTHLSRGFRVSDELDIVPGCSS